MKWIRAKKLKNDQDGQDKNGQDKNLKDKNMAINDPLTHGIIGCATDKLWSDKA